MEYFIKFIDSVIWPVTVLIILLIMKKPIASLLPFIESLKYKDFEIKFRKELEDAKAEAYEAGMDLQTSSGEKEEINRLVDLAPSAAIIESWRDLELSAKDKINELVKDTKELSSARRHPLTHLELSGALIPSTARTVRNLYNLRNQVAHSRALNITKEDALEYVTLAKVISKQIEAITELPKQKLTVLTLLVLEFNHIIDTGKYNNITIEDIHREIENKNIIPYIAKRTAGDSDFTIFTDSGSSYANYVAHYHEQMYELYGGYAGNERRKWGVENLGLCLLVAWTNELIQQGAGWHPDK